MSVRRPIRGSKVSGEGLHVLQGTVDVHFRRSDVSELHYTYYSRAFYLSPHREALGKAMFSGSGGAGSVPAVIEKVTEWVREYAPPGVEENRVGWKVSFEEWQGQELCVILFA